MDNEKSLAVLNDLVQINNDRIEGYEKASMETKDADLKTLFSELMYTSQKCRAELSAEVMKLGGTPTEETKTSGKFFRAWMDVKAALTGNDRKAILSSCEFREDAAVNTYINSLKNNTDVLSSDHQGMINVQYSLIKADHDKVKKGKKGSKRVTAAQRKKIEDAKIGLALLLHRASSYQMT